MIKKVIVFLIILALFVPNVGYAQAVTLRDEKNMLNQFIADQSKNQAQINQTNNQINAARNQINAIKKQIQEMQQEVDKMQKEIVEYNNEITEKKIQTKEIISYYQLTKSGNLYLDYAFGAETITDLIYRLSVVEQLISFNERTIRKLNEMIENNKKRTKELEAKEIEVGKKQEELAGQVTRLTGVRASLNENHVSITSQVQIYRDRIKALENQGCKDHHVIGRDCAVNNNVVGWHRPVESGYVTSEAGYRWGSLHRGLDISNRNPFSTRIFPVANGRVTARYSDAWGALTIVMEHQTVDGRYYSSLYTHLSSYAPGVVVGSKLTAFQHIGVMGNTGLSHGPHLHLEIAPCRLFNRADSNCGTWDGYVNFTRRNFDNGSWRGPRNLLWFPSTNVTFNGRG